MPDERPHPSAYSRALRRVLRNTEITPEELADVGEPKCSARKVRQVANERAQFCHEKADTIRRYLARSDYIGPSARAFPQGWRHCRTGEAEVNETVSDDVAEIVRRLGHLQDAEDQLDQKAGRQALRKIRKELRDCEAEVETWE